MAAPERDLVRCDADEAQRVGIAPAIAVIDVVDAVAARVDVLVRAATADEVIVPTPPRQHLVRVRADDTIVERSTLPIEQDRADVPKCQFRVGGEDARDTRVAIGNERTDQKDRATVGPTGGAGRDRDHQAKIGLREGQRVGRRVDRQRAVPAVRVVDRVVPVAGSPSVVVRAVAADQQVRAGSALQRVVPLGSHDPVVAVRALASDEVGDDRAHRPRRPVREADRLDPFVGGYERVSHQDRAGEDTPRVVSHDRDR